MFTLLFWIITSSGANPAPIGNTGFRETESPAIKLLGAEVTVDDVWIFVWKFDPRPKRFSYTNKINSDRQKCDT